MLAVVAPGQGAQSPGFLAPWLELAPFRVALQEYAGAAGLDLVQLGTQASAEEIRSTDIAQPLIVAASLASAAALVAGLGDWPDQLVAGHSVGEVTALGLAEVVSPAQAVALAARRGQAMHQACQLVPTGMTAVVGPDAAGLADRLVGSGLGVANYNGAAQVVVGGSLTDLDALGSVVAGGYRLMPLAVEGAFHTHYMDPALPLVTQAVAVVTPRPPRCGLVMNRDGQVVRDAGLALRNLAEQVTRPVRWDRCMATLAAEGVTGVLELAPAGVLSGMLRREQPALERFPLRTPADLDQALAFCRRHGG
jgi:[acyl-carrier-protein] S-malonyltransferase